MVVHGEYRCYHCAEVVARVVSDLNVKGSPVRLELSSAASGGRTVGGRLRCERCNGPVYLDEAPMTFAEQVSALETVHLIRPRVGLR